MNAGAVTLQYDGDGNRVAKTVGSITTRYLIVSESQWLGHMAQSNANWKGY
jgi:hypothetical protein